ncbi:MAG: thiamine pyrophosphate-binding protein [Candidatus Omnitrophica bacterium]|nr:thiamine pyrophosphate-binding protein [Candidatus Omnitrophota bacterium]MDD5771561.1 thiamine pyrophosphate-binding protein [Candidatus Omnitrophota bacterium]
MNVVESIILALKNRNLKVIFGVPGMHNLAFFEALRKGGIKTVVPTQEMNAGFMADGYGRVSGSSGACIICPGPGITSVSSAVAEASADSSSMVVFAVDIQSGCRPGRLHGLRQKELMSLLSKKIYAIGDNDNACAIVEEAFRESQRGEPGPVFVSIPFDCLEKGAGSSKMPEEKALGMGGEIFMQVTQTLRAAHRCGIYAGRGALAASEKILCLAEMLAAPVATSVSGRGVIPENHPLSAGFLFGECGSRLARKDFERCDIILAFGCGRMSELAAGRRALRFKGKVILIDSGNDGGSSLSPWLFIESDVSKAVEKIIGLLAENRHEKSLDRVLTPGACSKTCFKELNHRTFFLTLRECLKEDAVLVTDTGNHQLWAISSYPVYKPYSFVTPSDFQAMGFGIPASIGAKLACPGREVVCVTGEGGFLMGGIEIITAVRERLPLKIFLINDGGFSLLKSFQYERYKHTHGTDCLLPELESMAKSLHAEYLMIGTAKELRSQIQKALQSKGVVIANVRLEDNGLAPYVSRLRRAEFGNMDFSEKISALGGYLRRWL